MNSLGLRIGIVVATAVLVGCGAEGRRTATEASPVTTAGATTTTTEPPTTPVTPSTATSTTAPTTSTNLPRPKPPAAPTTTTSPPASAIQVATVTAAELGGSWHEGCPVGPAQLRRLTIPYWGLDGQTHEGQMIVNANAVAAMRSVFTRLYAGRFPIAKMVTIDHYPGTGVQLDDESTADDNTAAFNCRNAVNPGGPAAWSEHAYGQAVDVNPVENPYVESNGVVVPPNGAPYVDRTVHRAGMAFAGSPLNAAFAAVGWAWGGTWGGNPDYQHFSVNGQ